MAQADFGSRNYWNELNDVIQTSKKAKNKNQNISLFDDDCNEIPDHEVPNHINKFFVSIGSKLADSITKDNSDYITYCRLNPNPFYQMNGTQLGNLKWSY